MHKKVAFIIKRQVCFAMSCGWREVRRQAFRLAHQKIRQKENELGRELTEDEFRQILRATLREEYARAIAECQMTSRNETVGEGS